MTIPKDFNETFLSFGTEAYVPLERYLKLKEILADFLKPTWIYILSTNDDDIQCGLCNAKVILKADEPSEEAMKRLKHEVTCPLRRAEGLVK